MLIYITFINGSFIFLSDLCFLLLNQPKDKAAGKGRSPFIRHVCLVKKITSVLGKRVNQCGTLHQLMEMRILREGAEFPE